MNTQVVLLKKAKDTKGPPRPPDKGDGKVSKSGKEGGQSI